MMHFVELDLLRDRLLESLHHLHGQPPLMPLVMGLALKSAGPHWAFALEALFVVLGALGGLALMGVLRRLGLSVACALGGAVAFSLLPAVVTFESYLFLTHPSAFLLLLTALLLARALERPTAARWTWLFLAAAALVLLRNAFHLSWMVLVFLLALRAAPPGGRRAVAVAFVLPLLLAGGWYAKNLAVSGRFEASSWAGFGLARKTWHQAPLEARRQWVDAGLLDPVAAVPVFGTVAEFAKVLGMPPPSGVPLLDRETKGSGAVNYHHAVYLEASRRMQREALRVVRRHPRVYLQNVAATAGVLFRPATDWPPVAGVRERLQPWCGFVEGLLHGRPAPWAPSAWMFLAAALLLAAGVRLPALLARPAALAPRHWLQLHLAGCVLYVWTVAVLMDTAETMRHRFLTEALVFAGGLAALARAAGALRSSS